jgi:macrophage erythroblast attacher
MEEYNTIIRELQNKNCESAFRWCQTNKSKLAKINSQFEIRLAIQEIIELIKKNQRDKALEYIRKCSLMLKNDNIDHVKKIMGCITFYKDIDKFPTYKYYFEEERWTDLVTQFKNDSYQVSGVTTQSGLETTLQVGSYKIPNNCLGRTFLLED